MTTAESSPAQTEAGAWPDYPTLLPKPLNQRHVRLLERARTHAQDFATRADEHDRENTFPYENYEAMKASGYAHMTLGEEYGGEGVDVLELCACQEQLAQGCSGTAIGVNMHIFGLGALQADLKAAAAPDPLRLMAVQAFGANKMIMSGSFSETGSPGAYFLPATKATKTEGGWLINGRKSYNSNLPAAEMIMGTVHLVDHPDGPDRVAMVVLPKGTQGLTTPGAESWDVMGVRASGSWDTVYDNVFVPDVMMPAPQGAAETFTAMAAFGAWFAMTLSSVYLGVAQAAVEWTTDYVTSRKPATEERTLAHMPGIQYQLAEMLALQEATRGLICRSAQDWVARPWTPDESLTKGAICKYIATNNNIRVVSLAMDIAGGPGLFRRFGLERLYRDVRAGKAHPPSDMGALEAIAKMHLGIPRDFSPRWG